MAQCSHRLRGKVRMKTNIEKVADSCAHFAGEARQIADNRISEAMEQSQKNMIATRRRPDRPIISDRPPEWTSRIGRDHRQRAMVTNKDIKTMYDHGES